MLYHDNIVASSVGHDTARIDVPRCAVLLTIWLNIAVLVMPISIYVADITGAATSAASLHFVFEGFHV